MGQVEEKGVLYTSGLVARHDECVLLKMHLSARALFPVLMPQVKY